MFLLIGIAIIVLLTAKFKVHAFFALLLACFIVGIGVGLPVSDVITISKDGFGNIMKSLGLIIILGTTLGIILDHSGSTKVMAHFILKKTGKRNSSLAMSITGFIVGLPIFCDSGYIVLSGLTRTFARKAGISITIISISLATSLYAVHCMVPPHPGVSAAAGIIGVDLGKLIIYGIIIAIPATIAGYLWANFAGKNTITSTENENVFVEDENKNLPSVLGSFLPVIIPVLLIAFRSIIQFQKTSDTGWRHLFNITGDPVIALSIGIVIAFICYHGWNKNDVAILLKDAAEKAGGILVIIGAGGAFGAILTATKIGQQFSQSLPLGSLGILFPFLLTFILKTAQGSSTVAIITAASILQPLLPALGLTSDQGHLLCVLSMGAGSMMISHTNDAYFWVITKFSGLEMNTMLKVYSIATLLMGITAFTMVYILSLFI